MNVKYLQFLLLLLGFLVLPTITYGQDEPPPEPYSAEEDQTTLDQFVYLPLLHNPLSPELIPPYVSTSYYLQDIADQAMLDLGCEIGIEAVDDGSLTRFVHLHVGQPGVNPDDETIRGIIMHASPPQSPLPQYVAFEDLKQAVQMLALGYLDCVPSNDVPLLTLAIGPNNDGAHIDFDHGAAWGQWIQEMNAELEVGPSRFRIQIVGAADLELGFNGPTETRNWVDGYYSVSAILYNLGTLNGCPSANFPNFTCGTVEYPDWTLDDMVHIMSGPPGSSFGTRAVPQIYDTAGENARQWTYLAEYIEDTADYDFRLVGTLSQAEACQQRGGCEGIDNDPGEAFLQLVFRLIEADTVPQNLEFASDIRWQVR